MTKIFKKKNKVLFVSKADHIQERGSYSVILSPEFYWIKKVKLPVKKEKDALKLAPSTFEGNLPAGDFSFAVRKVEDAFIMIAYNKKQIAQELEKVLPYKSDIAQIFFAQDALGSITACTAINDKAALSNLDGIIIQVPRACTDTANTLDDILPQADVAKHAVKLGSFDNVLLSSQDLILAGVLFGLLFVALLGEYIVYKSAVHQLDERKMAVIKEYNLPRTSMQLKSIKKSLLKKFEAQKKLRDLLFALSNVRLEKGEYIESIEATPKETTLLLHVASKERASAIQKMFPKDMKIKDAKFQDLTMTIKIAS